MALVVTIALLLAIGVVAWVLLDVYLARKRRNF